MTGIHKTIARAAFMKIAACVGKRLLSCLAVGILIASTGAPAWAQSFTEYQPSGGGLLGITAGPDGNLWFTEYNSSKIGKVTTTGTFTEYIIPTGASFPIAIAAGPDGNLWFTESAVSANKIGKVTTTGTFTEYTIPTGSSLPERITTGPDGNLWFTEAQANKIGKVTTTGTFTEYSIPTLSSNPVGITAGPDGNLWFTELNVNQIGKVTTTGTFTEYSILTASSGPQGITAGPDGNLWFTELNVNQIGKVTTTGTFTEYSIPTLSSNPVGITAGPDGNLWFTESANQIGKVTTAGTFTEYAIPTCLSFPQAITTGPDGNLWFTEVGANQIGVLNPTLIPTPTPTPGCPATPASGCRGAGKSLLLLKNSADDTKDKLTWKWIKGEATTLTDLGSPAGSCNTNYTLCVYAGTAVATVNLPAGSDWQGTGTTGFKFKDPSGTPDGAQKAVLKSGVAGKAKALVKGKGANLPDDLVPALPLPVTAQLVNDTNNVCFESAYTISNVIKNDAMEFKAKTP